MAKSTIVVRNLRFPLEHTPKYWLGGQRAVSQLLDHLSILFPPGERFFMDSVRAYDAQVQDPQLRKDMKGFHAQEALHGREHTHYNERLAGLGYPVRAIERSTRNILWLASKLFGRRGRLGITTALEHFTALFAQVALGQGSFLHAADPEMDALWRWHAAEENEHAAVAFDVYATVGGGYGLRVLTMVLVTLGFFSKIAQHQLMMMASDGILFSLSEWRSLYAFLFGSEVGILRRTFKLYLRYYARDFHPHQIETRELLDDWRREFESAPMYRDKLYRRKLDGYEARPAGA